MPAPTVAASSYAIMGPPNADGSQWVRSTLTISDGSTQGCDRPNVPAANDLNADLAALVAGVNATLAVVPTPVPSWAARTVIMAYGLQAEAEAAVASAGADVQALWYTAQNIDRDDPNLIAIGTAIGLSSDQIDDMFRAAAVL